MATSRFLRPTAQPLLNEIARIIPDARLSAYDGSASGPPDARVSISFNDPRVFARLVRAPRGLGLARAWVADEISVDGDLHYLAAYESSLRDPDLLRSVIATSIRVTFGLGWRGIHSAGPTAVEHRPARFGLRPVKRDLEEAEHHYGLSAEFYRILLGSSMTYSSGIFAAGAETLDDAQNYKHHVICGKLRINETSRVLDIGCGWGSFLEYVTARYGCKAIGITASLAQCRHARSRTSGATEILYGDYRQHLPLPSVTAVASIGMYEHVGARNSLKFFSLVRQSLPSGARYLNQAIIWPQAKPHHVRRNAFVDRYIFPAGQLLPISRQLSDLERAGFAIISVETFGDSYAGTIRRWIANLGDQWDACAKIEGEARVRAWYMYLTGALTRFEDQTVNVAQVLAEAR